MLKFNKISFVLILCFGLTAVYLFQTHGELSQSTNIISNGLSLDWASKKDPLLKLSRLSRTLYYIDSAYVDPKKVDPKKMFKEVVKDLSTGIPEVQVLFPNQDMALVSVNGKKREFSLHQSGLASLLSNTSEVLRFVRSQQVSRLNDEMLESYALNSILNTLDPHSIYMPKELYKETLVDTSGEFGGLGIVIGFREKKLSIISPIEDTPAYRAGLKSGDHIFKIEDESTEGMTLREAVKRMRGPKGTKVNISIKREAWDKEKSFSLTRAKIQIVSVESALLPKKVGYVRVKNFQQDTGASLRTELKKLRKQSGGNFKGLILDLRGNPGGILDQAVEVSDIFLKEGVIVSTVGFNNRINQKEEAKSAQTEGNYPMAILIDEGSASASEIVAGALKNRAVLIGRKSYGKGSVQRLFDLPEDSALKLTIAQYLARGDVSIQSIGITPDIETQAKIISEKGFNLFPSDEAYGEASLERHLENKKDKTPKEFFTKSFMTLSFLEQLDKDGLSKRAQSLGDSFEDRMKKISQDFEIRVAKTLLLGSNSNSKKNMLKVAPQVLSKLQKEEEKILTAALKEKLIDWSFDQKNKCALNLSVQKSFSGHKDMKAGDTRQLNVQVKNIGKCKVQRLWAEMDSDSYFLDKHEMIFGNLLPGESLSRNIEIEFPKGSSTSLLDYTLNFNSETSKESFESKSDYIVLNEISKPELRFSLSVKDKNGNGLADKDESLEVIVDVENIGIKTSDEASLNLKSTDSDLIEVVKSHHTLKNLDTGKHKKLIFLLKAKDLSKTEDVKLNLQFTDYNFQKLNNYPIILKRKLMASKKITSPEVSLDKLGILKNNPIKEKFLNLKGDFKGNENLIDYFVMVNNKKVFYSKFDTKSKKHAFSAEIPLEPGKNDVIVAVRNGSFVLGSSKFTLQRAQEL